MYNKDNLLKSEVIAVEFVEKYGRDRIGNLLTKLTNRIDRRYQRTLNRGSIFVIPRAQQWTSKFEDTAIHMCKIGLMITDDYNTPEAAHKRILERIKKRKEAAAAQRKANKAA